MEIEINHAKTLTDFIFLDVREINEWTSGHIYKAVHLPLSDLVKGIGLEKLSQNEKYIIYCQHGVRSLTAFNILKSLNFKDIFSLKGGFAKWQAEKPN